MWGDLVGRISAGRSVWASPSPSPDPLNVPKPPQVQKGRGYSFEIENLSENVKYYIQFKVVIGSILDQIFYCLSV